jgi:hypothetical protein
VPICYVEAERMASGEMLLLALNPGMVLINGKTY